MGQYLILLSPCFIIILILFVLAMCLGLSDYTRSLALTVTFTNLNTCALFDHMPARWHTWAFPSNPLASWDHHFVVLLWQNWILLRMGQDIQQPTSWFMRLTADEFYYFFLISSDFSGSALDMMNLFFHLTSWHFYFQAQNVVTLACWNLS